MKNWYGKLYESVVQNIPWQAKSITWEFWMIDKRETQINEVGGK